MSLRIFTERFYDGFLIRLFGPRRSEELAYLFLGLRGLIAQIEFPSDWHEPPRGWVRLSFGLFTLGFSFPWKWVVPDNDQCSGPTYGFCFFADGLQLHWGKRNGKSTDPFTIVPMPWRWNHRLHEVLSPPESHSFTYVLRSGAIQNRIALIQEERRVWTRWWPPFKRDRRYIDVRFNGEVGEKSGSWKGGVTGCMYEMLPGETPLDTLHRMEREKKFD